jgi:hypothetical protein
MKTLPYRQAFERIRAEFLEIRRTWFEAARELNSDTQEYMLARADRSRVRATS